MRYFIGGTGTVAVSIVDGGLANNCPIDLMRETVTATGKVIAAEVTGQVQLLPGALTNDGVYSGAKYLLNRLNQS